MWLMHACGLAATMRWMEILVVLVTVEPLAGTVGDLLSNIGQLADNALPGATGC